MNFLPDGLENLKEEKPYIKISELPEGDYKFRIVQKPIVGWRDWTMENKPLRFRSNQKPKAPINPEKKIQAFWAIHIWWYETSKLGVIEFTQIAVLKALEDLGRDTEWGNWMDYDLKINVSGTPKTKERKYTITPLPHKPLSTVILNAIDATPIRLEALYEGGDPWKDLEAPVKGPSVFDEPAPATLPELVELLRASMHIPMGTEQLLPYLEYCKPRVPKPMEEVVDAWIAAPDKFLNAYKEWIAKKKVA